MGLKLNLGCSDTQLAGFVGVDTWTPPWATDENFVRADLKRSWPWADGSVDHIIAHDIIEHLPDKIHTMNEIWRVLKPEATVEIIVPTTDGTGAWQDPTHTSYWNRNSFLYVTAGDPHYERFHEAYGIKGAFEVTEDFEERTDDYGVTKLRVVLEKVEEKRGAEKVVEIRKGENMEMKDAGGGLYVGPTDVTKDVQPIFSVVHASARPEKWKEVYDAWIGAAAWPQLVEYVLVLDSKFFTFEQAMEIDDLFTRRNGLNLMIWNNHEPNYVNNVNRGAKESKGMMILVNADDQYPCEGWDEKIANHPITGLSKHNPPQDYVIEVTTNTPNEHERGLIVMPIVTRRRYERLGYIFYPLYESMYADNDLCAQARKDGAVVDARDLVFPHKHPLVESGGKSWGDGIDAAYTAQNRPEAYALGEKVFKARVKANFATLTEEDLKEEAPIRPILPAAGKILFSLCHTTARLPHGWKAAAQAWFDNCDNPELVEYILTLDDPAHTKDLESPFPNTKAGVCNGDKKDCVAGWNYAAKLSTGAFIITVADDFFPCPHWDTELLKLIDFSKQQVLEVHTGDKHEDVMSFCMMTREYYSRYGYVYFPEYVSVFCDNDFTDQARKDGVVVDAKHLKFEHRHPTVTGAEPDAVYLHQGTPHAHTVGKDVYTRRTQYRGLSIKKKIAICAPGEHFSAAWMDAWTYLLAYIIGRYDLAVYFGYSSNVYVTRMGLAESILTSYPAADYVLWIDDDNLLTVAQLEMLIADLEAHPELDIVAGWTWIEADVYNRPGLDGKASVGTWHPVHGGCLHLSAQQLQDSPTDLIEIDWTGFPVVLMRYSALVKAGKRPFLPILTDNHAYGMSGEDTAFCKNAKDRGGCRIAVDRRVKVPHLKLRAAEPLALPSAAQQPELVHQS
jgi:hypothetical protein